MSDSRRESDHCERCGWVKLDVKYEVDCKLWLCNACWFTTRPAPPERRSKWEA